MTYNGAKGNSEDWVLVADQQLQSVSKPFVGGVFGVLLFKGLRHYFLE